MISCPSTSACGTSSYVSNCCSFVISFSRASSHLTTSSLGLARASPALQHSTRCTSPSCRLTRASLRMSRGSPKQGSQEFLHVSTAVLTRLPASTDASACSRFTSSWTLTSWSRYASSKSFQRLASPCLLPCRSPPRRVGVEAARPQVHVALLPVVQTQKVSLIVEVLLHLQVFSWRQPRRHAVLSNVPWSTRTLACWLCTHSYGGTVDEPRCTPCSPASKSTSHHELSALPEMVLSPKGFAANQ